MRYYIMREGNYISTNVDYNSEDMQNVKYKPNFAPEYFPVNKYDIIGLSDTVGLFSIFVNFDQQAICFDDDNIPKMVSFARLQEWNNQNKTTLTLYDNDDTIGRSYYAPLQVQALGICQPEKSVIEITEQCYGELRALYNGNRPMFKEAIRGIVKNDFSKKTQYGNTER